VSGPLVAIIGLIYLGVFASELLKKDWGMALVFFAYALGNLGFLISFSSR